MIRSHLEEDLALIQKYFPGAQRVSVRTPFDLTEPEDRQQLLRDAFRAEAEQTWQGGTAWMRQM